jgi:hypothetical protein
MYGEDVVCRFVVCFWLVGRCFGGGVGGKDSPQKNLFVARPALPPETIKSKYVPYYLQVQ